MKTINDVKDFINQSGADSIITELKNKLIADGEMPIYSDLYKEEDGKTFQYVNYVQEGGGVLGIALAGYTYVLEKLGFRFLKLAGTSAGAINTMLIAAINKDNYAELKDVKVETQSEIILLELLNKNLWDLVDGSRFGKWIIQLAITNTSRLKFIIKLLFASLIISILYPLYCFTLKITNNSLESILSNYINIVAFASVLLLVCFLLIVLYYLYRFDKAHFGVNPGNNFYDWIKTILEKNKVYNSDDLNNLMDKRYSGLSLRQDTNRSPSENTTKITPPFLTLITSDITNQLKVEFPKMASEYWTKDRLATISPASFVRASMSIPIFFAPFRITVDESVINSGLVQNKGLVATQYSKVKLTNNSTKSYQVHFVDGGTLSNFPFSVFHNPAIKIARMPTFGAKLEDTEHISGEEIEKIRLKFFPYIYKIFNTVRYNYDKDFLSKNSVYEQCIGHIDVADKEFNWLNFDMDNKTKIDLFRKGAEAAKVFLLGGTIWKNGRENKFEAFNWSKFKEERARL